MIYGLAAAVGWGLADFSGAVAGRRIGSVATVIVGQVLSALFMTALMLISGEPVAPITAIIGWVALNGLFTANLKDSLWNYLKEKITYHDIVNYRKLVGK